MGKLIKDSIMKSPLLPFSSTSRRMSLLSLSSLRPPQEVANAMQCVGEGDYAIQDHRQRKKEVVGFAACVL